MNDEIVGDSGNEEKGIGKYCVSQFKCWVNFYGYGMIIASITCLMRIGMYEGQLYVCFSQMYKYGIEKLRLVQTSVSITSIVMW